MTSVCTLASALGLADIFLSHNLLGFQIERLFRRHAREEGCLLDWRFSSRTYYLWTIPGGETDLMVKPTREGLNPFLRKKGHVPKPGVGTTHWFLNPAHGCTFVMCREQGTGECKVNGLVSR